MSWAKLVGWSVALYVCGLIGYFVKASQTLDAGFENVWQFVALAFLPAIPFVLFAVPFLIWLAIKSFNISRCGGFAKLLATVYVAWILFQMISSRPL